jgi:hypothetical protein
MNRTQCDARRHSIVPHIELAGSTGGLALSGALTLLPLPIAALAVLRQAPASPKRCGEIAAG